MGEVGRLYPRGQLRWWWSNYGCGEQDCCGYRDGWRPGRLCCRGLGPDFAARL